MRNLMIALGTIGVKPGCTILSIGAVPFDLASGETGSPFFTTISEGSNLMYGLLPEDETIDWWKTQPEEVKSLNFRGEHSLPHALRLFNKFITETFGDSPVYAWSNHVNRCGLGILDSAYRATQVSYPFDPFSERDSRTLLSLLPHYRHMIPFEGDRKNPIHEALHAIQCIYKVHSILNDALDKALT